MLDSHRQLREMADIDMLTQVPNRRHFNDMAARALRLACPGQTTLMRFDVDHLRQFNEQHGHAAGDEALTLVASRARGLMRERGDMAVGLLVAFLLLFPLGYVLHVAPRFPGSLVGGVIGAQFGSRFGVRLKAEQTRILLAILVLLVCGKLAYDLIIPPRDIYSIAVS